MLEGRTCFTTPFDRSALVNSTAGVQYLSAAGLAKRKL
jgi:hypothetical protein